MVLTHGIMCVLETMFTKSVLYSRNHDKGVERIVV